ncbi:MAG: ABC transporter substrate-binding protein [Candidatus Bathyarchaeia archaeon]
MGGKSKALAVFVLLLASAFLFSTTPVYATGPATDTLIFKRVPVDLAGEALKAGDIDYYIYGLRPAQAEALSGLPDISLYYAPSALVDIVLNPAPAPSGELNPFSIKEVRFAINYLMDRDYIANQIYKGFASPMVTFLSTYDPDFVTIYDIVAKYDFKYDPTTAAAIINSALTKAGATKREGKWYYGGKPITLNFIIRIEDERREIGDALASALESMGFTVNRQYMPFGQAIPILYGTDPKDFQWHLYTEGWGKSAVDKYDYGTINQFGCPWMGWMPGWQEAGYWQYENSTLDELGQRIYKGNFTSKAERDSLYRTATEMIIQESVRIWAATRLDIHPARKEVKGITNDLGTGLRSPFDPREVYITGKSEVKVGHLWVWTEASVWNPIAGHDDVYSSDMWVAVHDPFVWRHPFSGKPIPFRWSYTVTTAGPRGKLDVPSDAFLWNAKEDKWVAVGSGVKATSKVVFDLSKYIGAKWHHGQTITWADVLFSIYQHYELAFDPEKAALESSTSAVLAETLPLIKGLKIVGKTLEVYLDFWHFDVDYIADYADLIGGSPPMGNYPWEVLAAMDKVVFVDGTAAYSQSASKARGVPWLSVALNEHAKMVKDAIADFASASFFPENVFNVLGTRYAAAAEAKDRYDAAIKWFNEKGHMVVSDGPFYLDSFNPAGQYAVLKAFRDPTYPFSKGDWFYGIPTSPEIVRTGVPTIVTGSPASFVVDLSGIPPLHVKYLMRDPLTGEILDIGDAESVTATRFVIALSEVFTSKLKPGLYELTLAAYSEEVAFITTTKVFFDVLSFPEVEIPEIEIPEYPSLQPVLDALNSAVNSLNKAIDGVNNAVNGVSGQLAVVNTNLTNSISSLNNAVASLTSTVNTLMIVVAVVAVLTLITLALTLWLILKKK